LLGQFHRLDTVAIGQRVIGNDEIVWPVVKGLVKSRFAINADDVSGDALRGELGTDQRGIIAVVFQVQDAQWRRGHG